jgi:hypothetical protein
MGCPLSQSPPDDGGLDAAAPVVCSGVRTTTLVVIANNDDANDFGRDVGTATVELVHRLLDGDVDADGRSDFTPMERVRVLVTFNVPRARAAPDDVACSLVGLGGEWTSSALDAFCPDSAQRGNPVLDIRAGDDFEADLRCLVERQFEGECVIETFDAMLAALSPAAAPVDLTPLVGLGDGVNAAYQDSSDVLVVLMQQADRRDDCSRRIFLFPRDEGVCSGGGDDPYCCDENLPPVTRTSTALRQILRGRPVAFGAYAATPPFDPTAEDRELLDTFLSDGFTRCVYVVPHLRTVGLARELYPDMHLLPLVCRGPLVGGERPPIDVTGLARHAFARLCSP